MGACADCGNERDLKQGVCFRCRMMTVGFASMTVLKKERESGTCQAEIKKEIFDAAKADGRDVQKKDVSYT